MKFFDVLRSFKTNDQTKDCKKSKSTSSQNDIPCRLKTMKAIKKQKRDTCKTIEMVTIKKYGLKMIDDRLYSKRKTTGITIKTSAPSDYVHANDKHLSKPNQKYAYTRFSLGMLNEQGRQSYHSSKSAEMEASFEYMNKYDVFTTNKQLFQCKSQTRSFVQIKQPSMGISAYSIKVRRCNTPSFLNDQARTRSSFYESIDSVPQSTLSNKKATKAFYQPSTHEPIVSFRKNTQFPGRPYHTPAVRRRIFSTGVMTTENIFYGFSTDV